MVDGMLIEVQKCLWKKKSEKDLDELLLEVFQGLSDGDVFYIRSVF